jgi:hypothetical protein
MPPDSGLPSAGYNCLVERIHFRLKDALRDISAKDNWADDLVGLHFVAREDDGTIPAKAVFVGTPLLSLPGHFSD